MEQLTFETLSKRYGNFYVPRFTVTVGGEELTEATGVVSGLTVDSKVGTAAEFTFTLTPHYDHEHNAFQQFEQRDGLLWDTGRFEALDFDSLRVGTPVTVHVGYGDAQTPLVNGQIASVKPSFPESGTPTITVRGYDSLRTLADRQTTDVNLKETSVADVVSELATKRGFDAVTVEPSPAVNELRPKIQRTAEQDDFEFLTELADDIGYELHVSCTERGDVLSFRPVDSEGDQPMVALRYGESLRSFAVEENGTGQPETVEVHGFDAKNRTEVKASARNEDDTVAGQTEGSRVLCRPVRTKGEADTAVRAEAARLKHAQRRGSGTALGLPELCAGTTILVAGVAPYNGAYYVESVTHSIDTSGYTTRFRFGAGDGANERAERANRGRRQMGVTVGLVTDNEDPEGLGRVRVTTTCLGDDVSHWAPIAVPMAGAERGTYFLPEPDEEVLVAFQDGDVEFPFVVGSLWNLEEKPPASNDDGKNDVRLVRSRSGHELRFDDGDDGAVEITSAGGNRIRLSDESGSETVTIADASGENTIEIATSDGAVSIGGAAKVALSAPMLELAADGNIDVQAGGVLTLKGSLVNINS
ncbi:phage baseplate assembly protein V [Halogeometricum limi]|uniref:Uncharacterized conserved protein, implicated in type VI secretion and phage assembly n=1 Tax=Halogeometricum limi TaxID=555875 RepID=A0A1I6IEG3_9EURY|nr:phage baseplate assembly protein V [Halogeometricum limi]SFR65155.1 Uncharacterized conserved protein, implicated in type VI secretion and phage assembly [Halogeometricum limi]